jgi:hypothetical protein
MPQNGAAVALPVELDPHTTSDVAPARPSNAQRIGEVIADAALMVTPPRHAAFDAARPDHDSRADR